MADARLAVTSRVHDHDFREPDDSEFYTFRLKIPRPKTVLDGVRTLWLRFATGLWPASTASLVTSVVLTVAVSMEAGPKSYLRSGTLAKVVFAIDRVVNPFSRLFPEKLRVGYLSAWLAVFAVYAVVSVRRVMLKSLLTYNGWLYSKERTPVIKAWGYAVRVLSGRRNLLYGFQNSLPHLPLPPLEMTLRRYLLSVKPLLGPKAMEDHVKAASVFASKTGKDLQSYLWWRHALGYSNGNYVTEWWDKFVYLKSRQSCMINSNYYVMDLSPRCGLDSEASVEGDAQILRAANLTHQFLVFKDLVETESLEPMTLKSTVPLCMNQYRRMFGTTRVPGREIDVVKHVKGSKHIVVVKNGSFFRIDAYDSTTGKPKSASEMARIFGSLPSRPTAHVRRRSLASGMSRAKDDFITPRWAETVESYRDLRDFEFDEASGRPVQDESIALFTAGPRTRWAEIRESFFARGSNRYALHAIESSAFVVWLRDEHFNKNPTLEAKSLFHGNDQGQGVWFDKSLNLICFKDGRAGLNAEHSWADAPIVAHLWEHALLSELKDARAGLDARVDDYEPPRVRDSAPWTKLELSMDDGLADAIYLARKFAVSVVSDLDLAVSEFRGFGSDFVKQNGQSPDAFVQMALQLAYFREIGRFDLTYEACMTRLFKNGRTETVRVLSPASVAFVELCVRKPRSSKTKSAFAKACDAHQRRYKQAMSGAGVDRHMFALSVVSKALDVECSFLDDVQRLPWRLSTSQQPQNQTSLRRDLFPDAKVVDFFSPGGGFGPVADDGFGVSYMLVEDAMFFHVSSKKSSPKTNSSRFASAVVRALNDCSRLL